MYPPQKHIHYSGQAAAETNIKMMLHGSVWARHRHSDSSGSEPRVLGIIHLLHPTET